MAWKTTRAELASEHHKREPDALRIADLRRQFRYERAEEYLKAVIAGPPALAADDLGQLASLLTRAAVRAATRDAAPDDEVLDARGLQDCGYGGGLDPDAA